MTRRLAGAVLAGAFALGVLTGSAGTIIVRESTTPATDYMAAAADHMTNIRAMHSMMSGGTMMGGSSAPMMPGSVHDQHHPAAAR